MTGLPQGWVDSTLGALCEKPQYGWTTKAHVEGDGVRFLRTTDITRGPINWRTVPACTEAPTDLAKYELKAGDIVVSRAGSVGASALIDADPPMPSVFASYLIRMRPLPEVNERYVKWFMHSPSYWDQISESAAGIALQNVNAKKLAAIRMPVAPLDEQRRIVEAIETHLSHLDAGVESLERAKRNIERMRAAVLHQLLGSVDAPFRPLGDLAEVVGGVTKDKKREQDPGVVEVPYLRVANVQRGYLDLDELKTIRAPAAKVETLLLEPGDVLFTEGGDRDKLGRGWVWEGQEERCIHQNHVFRARLRGDDLLPKFVSTYANVLGRGWFEAMGKQTTNLASINLTTLKRFPVPVPPVAVQAGLMDKISWHISVLDALDLELARAEARADQLRRAVLGAAFSGRFTSEGEVPA